MSTKAFATLMKDLAINCSSSFVLLMETHANKAKVALVISRAGFDSSFIVESRGQAEFWKV